MTREEVTRLWELAKAEETQNRDRVFKYLQTLTPGCPTFRMTDITYNYQPDISITITFLNNREDPEVKSSYFEFDIAYKAEYDWETKTAKAPELLMGCGSYGMQTKKQNPGKVYGYHMMGVLWEHETEFTKLLDTLSHDASEAYSSAKCEYDLEQAEIKRKGEEAHKAEVAAQVKVGFEFSEQLDNRRQNKYEYKITKMTPKRCYLEVVRQYKDWRYRWEDSKCVGREDGVFSEKFTCYMETSRLLSRLINGTEHYCDLTHGEQPIGNQNFTVEKFTPSTNEED